MIANQLIPAERLARLSDEQLTALDASIGTAVLRDKRLMKRLERLVQEISADFEQE